jgi:toxin ParE1/3/4
MSLQIELFPHAESDLSRQYEWYVEHADVDIAEKYLKAFDVTVQELALHPGLGRLRKFRSPALAELHSYTLKSPFDKHLAFYKANRTTLSIVRVIHGARDLPRRLLQSD